MASIPKRVRERILTGLRRYQRILAEAKARDVNESDTVTIVRDMLSDILGYGKYTEVTSEYEIRGHYCDLAIKSEVGLAFLIEVKAIGLDLRENHLRQVVGYGVTQGIEWVVLTNGAVWEAYKVIFEKPIRTERVFTLDLLESKPRDVAVLESLFSLSKEGLSRRAIAEYHEARRATSRHALAALLLSEPVLSVLRREVRRVSRHARVHSSDLATVLKEKVIKREVLEGEAALAARKMVRSSQKKSLRGKREENGGPAITGGARSRVASAELPRNE